MRTIGNLLIIAFAISVIITIAYVVHRVGIIQTMERIYYIIIYIIFNYHILWRQTSAKKTTDDDIVGFLWDNNII